MFNKGIFTILKVIQHNALKNLTKKENFIKIFLILILPQHMAFGLVHETVFFTAVKQQILENYKNNSENEERKQSSAFKEAKEYKKFRTIILQ